MENDVKDNVISLEQILTSLLSRLSDIVYTNTVHVVSLYTIRDFV